MQSRSNKTPEPILGAHFRMPGLSDIERILLVSDGTFTFQLEAFAREPIGVEILERAGSAIGRRCRTPAMRGRRPGLGPPNSVARQKDRHRLLLRDIGHQ